MSNINFAQTIPFNIIIQRTDTIVKLSFDGRKHTKLLLTGIDENQDFQPVIDIINEGLARHDPEIIKDITVYLTGTIQDKKMRN